MTTSCRLLWGRTSARRPARTSTVWHRPLVSRPPPPALLATAFRFQNFVLFFFVFLPLHPHFFESRIKEDNDGEPETPGIAKRKQRIKTVYWDENWFLSSWRQVFLSFLIVSMDFMTVYRFPLDFLLRLRLNWNFVFYLKCIKWQLKLLHGLHVIMELIFLATYLTPAERCI